MRRHTLSLMILAALSGLAGAQGFRPQATAAVDSVPNGMNYQGRLEKDGFPVSGDKVMAFRLYDAATGGNVLYNSGNVTVTITQGIFGTSLDIPFTALTGTSQKYIEIDVDGITLAPRDPIRAVPYAKVAETVEGTIDVTNSGLTFTTPIGDALAISSGSGRVGIGTNSPVARLTVSSGTGETGNIFVVSTGAVTLAAINGNGQVTANAFFGDGTTLTGLVRKAGDGMTGPMTLNASSLTVHGAADFGSIGTKSVFSAAGALTMASGANIVLSGVGRITGLVSPASPSEAASKQYIDTVVVSSTGWTATPGVVRLTTVGDSAGLGTSTPQEKLDVVGGAAFGSGATRSTFSTSGVLTLAAPLATAQGGTGNAAGTVASLTANGTNCNAGEAALGVSAAGVAEGCYDVATEVELVAHLSSAAAHSATSANTASRIVMRDASGNFSANTINANITGTITGNAATASALLADPTDCTGVNFAKGIAADGTAACSPIADADVPNSITIDAAAALTANPADCGSGLVAAGIIATGVASCAKVDATAVNGSTNSIQSDALFDHNALNGTSAHGATNANTINMIVSRDGSGNFSAGTITASLTGNVSGNVTGNVTGNADTATNLSANPADCGSGLVAAGITASGAASCARVDAAAVNASTNPITSNALFDHDSLTGTSAHGATNANTINMIVSRDGSGNFSAGTITANLTGNVSGSAGSVAATGVTAGSLPTTVIAQTVRLQSLNKATLLTTTGNPAGTLYYCSDCTAGGGTGMVVVSTGVANGNFASASGGPFF